MLLGQKHLLFVLRYGSDHILELFRVDFPSFRIFLPLLIRCLLSQNLIICIASNRALNLVELFEPIMGDDAKCIFLLLLWSVQLTDSVICGISVGRVSAFTDSRRGNP